MSKNTDKGDFVNEFIDNNTSFSGFTLPTMHKLDTDKIKTVEDIILVLKAIRIEIGTDHPMYDEVKHLLEEDGD